MTVIRYQPWSLLTRLQRELDQPLVPRVTVREEDSRYVLSADLPGVAPENIEITHEAGVLTLKAVRKTAGSLGDAEAELRYQRSFTLPEDASGDEIVAKSALGVLELSIARAAKPQARRIQVQAA
jgi:HSP20 family protein